MKPVEIEFLIKNGTKATLEQITTDLNQVGREGSESVGATSTAFENAQRQALILCNIMEQLEGKIKELQSTPANIDQTENIAQIEVLQKKIEELKVHIKQLEEVSEDTQVLPPSMPMAKRQFDGLYFSIQQMAREMPTLAMGPQMFFLAISNNLPIFSDELARARREYAELIKTGQKGTPVWKQVIKSLLSWQTAMTTGIMLLVMYGDEIVKSISDMTGWGAAKRKMREELEKSISVEKEAIGVAAKTRLELIQTMTSIRNFNGTKDEERQKIDELNSKYGESFGYYQTLAKWYDTLTSKTEAYTNVLILQNKNQSLVNDYIGAEQKVKEIEMTPDSDYDTWRGYGGKVDRFFSNDPNYKNNPNGDIHKKEALQKAKADVEDIKTRLETNATEIADIIKNNNIDQVIVGSVADFEKSIAIRRKELLRISDPKEYKKKLAEIEDFEIRLRAITGTEDPKIKKTEEKETDFSKEIQTQRFENKQERIDQLRDGSEKVLAQIKLNYDKEISEIEKQEERWKEAQNGKLTEEQTSVLAEGKTLLINKKIQETLELNNSELEENKKKLSALRDQFKTFDQKRRDIDLAYADDKKQLEEELIRIQNNGGDATDIKSTISAREEMYKASIERLRSEILTSSEFYQKLFSSISEKGYSTLKNFYSHTKEVIDNAKVGSDFVTITIPENDNGAIVKKQVKVTVEEYQKMVKQMSAIGKQLEKENPFKAVSNSFTELIENIKGGDKDAIANSMKSLENATSSTLDTMNRWGDSLGRIFGNQVGQAFDEIMELVGGVADLGLGVGKIASGDIVGGITDTLAGIGSIVQSLTRWREKEAQQQREWYMAEIEVNRLLDERNLKLAQSRDIINDIIKDQELLNWLIENGFIDKNSSSVWESQYEAYNQAIINLKNERDRNNKLWGDIQNSNAEWSGKNGSLSWYSVEHSLRGMSAEQIELYYQQNKLSDSARDYYEAWKQSGESIESLMSQIEELGASMREMVMGVSFDSFLESSKNALLEMRGDIGSLADFTEDTISKAILNAFMYKHMAKVLEPLYNELSDAFINGTADADFLLNWRKRYESSMVGLNNDLKDIENITGIDLSKEDTTSQKGRSGSFETMSQEQGTKLEGLFTANEMRTARIEETVERVDVQMSIAVGHLAKIEENTGDCAEYLESIKDDIKRMINDGLKVK